VYAGHFYISEKYHGNSKKQKDLRGESWLGVKKLLILFWKH